jgi:conjugal transfer ATP-binding protein TraC
LTGSLAEQINIWGFEDHAIQYRDGSLGAALELTPCDISCLGEAERSAISLSLRDLLQTLPEGYRLQVCYQVQRAEKGIVRDHADLIRSMQPVVQAVTTERREYFEQKIERGHLWRRTITLFVRTPSKKARSSFWRRDAALKVEAAEFSKSLLGLNRVVCNLEARLEAFKPKRLTSQEVYQRLFAYWNPDRKVAPLRFDPTEVREFLTLTDVLVEPSGVTCGGVHSRVLSLKLLPETTFAGMAEAFMALPLGSCVCVTVGIPSQSKEYDRLQTQRRIAFSMVQGRGQSVRDIESESKLADLEQTLEATSVDGEKIVDVFLAIKLDGESSDDVDGKVDQALRVFQTFGGAEGVIETLATFPLFVQLAPAAVELRERTKRVLGSNAADMLALFGYWTGHDSPSVLLRSRGNELVRFDPFDRGLTNANMIVTGGSGAGKSFLTNVLLLHLLKEDPKVFVIDIGGSYKKLARNLGGNYIMLGVENDLALNPFDLSEGEAAPSPSKIKFLVSLIESMCKEAGAAGLSRFEKSEIEAAICRIYERLFPKIPTLSDLREEFVKSGGELARLSAILRSWCGESAFGRLLDRSTSVQLDGRRLVCFDLKGLEAYPELQAACLLVITDFVWREVQKNPGTKKFLVFDECWRLLESEGGASFIGDVFRTFRKYYASAIAISQNLDDFARSVVAGAVMTNSSIKWVLMQKGADPQRLREVLRANDAEMELINSLTQKRGHYSEAFLIAGDNRGVVSVETTPLEYWIATTDPRESAYLEGLVKEFPDIGELDILHLAASRYPTGLFGQQKA